MFIYTKNTQRLLPCAVHNKNVNEALIISFTVLSGVSYLAVCGFHVIANADSEAQTGATGDQWIK